MKFNEINAIIFDLGRVVIHLEETRTDKAFMDLSGFTTDQLQEIYKENKFFHAFERGEIADSDFRNSIKEALKQPGLTDDTIDDAWNAMLGNIDQVLIKKIQGLQTEFKMFVLSNTNIIHERAFNKILHQSTGHSDLHGIFDKVYFSHEINTRKPELRSWEMIINEQQLDPSRVLFLDDRLDNIEAGQSLGLQCIQIRDPMHTMEILRELEMISRVA